MGVCRRWCVILVGMIGQTPYQQLRQIEASVNRFGNAIDRDAQTAASMRSFEALRRDVRLARDTLKDYEMFELEEDTRKQAKLLPQAIKSLEKVRASLLKASEYELISAIDVAQLSAELDELIDKLH
jgi:hypothetical protein